MGYGKRLTLLSLIILLLVACSSERNGAEGKIVEIDLLKTTGETDFLNNVKEIKLIPLETNDSCLINNCDRIIVEGEKIFVFDEKQQTVFCFDMQGRFISRLNRRGRSGQEYLEANDIFLSNGNIGVFDNMKPSVLFYGQDGKYVNSIPVCGGTNAGITTNGRVVIYSGALGEHDISVFDNAGKLLCTGYKVPGEIASLPIMFSPSLPLSIVGDEIYYTNYFDPVIYSLSEKGVGKEYVFDFGAFNISADLLKNGDPQSVFDRVTKDKSVKTLENMTVSPSLITFKVNMDGNKSVVIYYNRISGEYFTNRGIKMPLSVLFSNPPLGYSADGYYFNTVSSSNMSGAIVPMLQHEVGIADRYEFLKSVNPEEVKYDNNPWITLYKVE